jgi:hypothetical protein
VVQKKKWLTLNESRISKVRNKVKTKMKCSTCDYKSDKLNLIIAHQKSHRINSNSNFNCYHCGIIFSNYKNFKVHLFRFHRNNSNPSHPTPPINPISLISCKSCQFFSENKNSTLKHAAKHLQKDQTVECPLCSKSIFSEANLKTHFQRHHSGPFLPNSKRTQLESPKISPQDSSCVPTNSPQNEPVNQSDRIEEDEDLE